LFQCVDLEPSFLVPMHILSGSVYVVSYSDTSSTARCLPAMFVIQHMIRVNYHKQKTRLAFPYMIIEWICTSGSLAKQTCS